VRSTGRFSRLRGWAQGGSERTARTRAWTSDLLARIPVLGRLVSELVRVEVIDRSLAIGAQALLAVLPLLVVVAAFAPPSFGADVLAHIRDAMGLGPEATGPLQKLVLPESELRQETGYIGLLITLISATSFSRALQRTYAKIWDLTGVRRSGAVRSSVIWLVGWLIYLDGVVLVGGLLADVPGHPAPQVVVLGTFAVLIWWWGARVLLLWRVAWSHLLPTAVLTALGMLLLTTGSNIVMPRYVKVSVEQFGTFGLVLAAASWLVAFGFVVIVMAVVGRVFAEHAGWGRFVDRAAGRRHTAVATRPGTTDSRRL